MKILFLTVALIICKIGLIAQTSDPFSYPEVGKPMPELTIHNIKYFFTKEARITDFRGKWLLLDFWDIHCGACIASFPYVNEIQKKLGDSVQVILVGIQDDKGLIEPLYAKYREKQHLLMPCAFDSVLANRLDIGFVPHSILIDDRGNVRCITPSLNVADIRGYLTGYPPALPASYRWMHAPKDLKKEHYDFDSEQPFLMNGNGGRDSAFLFRSILSTWDRNLQQQYTPPDFSKCISDGRFQVLGAPLEWLYNYAYFGQSDWYYQDTVQYGRDYPHPVLEIKDSSKFRFSRKYGRNMFSYSLIMPQSQCTERSMKRAIQRDLETYFGFESLIETRNCPCWKLIADKGAREKLRTKGEAPFSRQLIYGASFTAGNYPFRQLINWIRSRQYDKVIIDETDITDNIDITMDCIPTDLNDLQIALRSYGLELVPSTMPMRVVVIRDKVAAESMK